MARGAVRLKHTRALGGVAVHRLHSASAGERAHIREHFPDLGVARLLRAKARHLGAGHAAPNGTEDPRVAGAGVEDGRQIRSADAARVEAVAPGAARAIEQRAAFDRILVALERILHAL